MVHFMIKQRLYKTLGIKTLMRLTKDQYDKPWSFDTHKGIYHIKIPYEYNTKEFQDLVNLYVACNYGHCELTITDCGTKTTAKKSRTSQPLF